MKNILKNLLSWALTSVFALVMVLFLLIVAVPGTGIASAHSSPARIPARFCQIALAQDRAAALSGNVQLMVAAAANLTACEQLRGTALGSSLFGFNFNNSVDPWLAFGLPTGFVPGSDFDGFSGSVGSCPAGTFAVQGGLVTAPTWACAPGLGGPQRPGFCPPGEHIVETGSVLSPFWACVV